MQVFHHDFYDRKLLCVSNTAAVSVFFQIDDSAADNPFFDWQADAKNNDPVSIDLTQIISKIAGMINHVDGYDGSDSMPPCTQHVCWYLFQELQTVTSD